MTQTNDIIEFVKDHSGASEVNETSDIFADLGVSGDDFHELIDKYAEIFKVDMSQYLWYFHSDEEGSNIGALLFDPPYKQVERISVTPIMLLEFAIKGKWDIPYPNHDTPIKRYDLVFNKVILVCFLIFVIIWIIEKLIK